MPCHANEKWAIMTIISWPPFLRVCHQRQQIFFQRRIIKLRKRLTVIEIRIKRAGFLVMLMQDIQIKLVWPPFAV